MNWKRMLRFTLVLAGVITCLLEMINVLRAGQARYIIRNGGSLAAANMATQLTRDDPEVYRARASILAKRRELALAADDLRQAIALQPRDYVTWLELAQILHKSGDINSALAALFEARTLAPSYFIVRWQMALLLQSAGRPDEAFREFRAASSIVPAILPAVIENAWKTYAGNCGDVERAVDPRTPQERLALANFFINKDKAEEALNLAALISNDSPEERRNLVRAFLQTKNFAEAYELWARGQSNRVSNSGGIDDGGFENDQFSADPGFTWVIYDKREDVAVVHDRVNPHSGSSSLRINWNGNPNPSDEIISQLVPVKPNASYQLEYVTRAQDLITAAGPVVTVVDVSQRESKKLARSFVLPLGSSGWRNLHVDFVTGSSTRAVQISLQRQNCGERCPIFGTLWLDDFKLSQR